MRGAALRRGGGDAGLGEGRCGAGRGAAHRPSPRTTGAAGWRVVRAETRSANMSSWRRHGPVRSWRPARTVARRPREVGEQARRAARSLGPRLGAEHLSGDARRAARRAPSRTGIPPRWLRSRIIRLAHGRRHERIGGIRSSAPFHGAAGFGVSWRRMRAFARPKAGRRRHSRRRPLSPVPRVRRTDGATLRVLRARRP